MNEPKIATGDDAIALRLEEFIRYYQPKHWCVPIHDVDFAPFLSASDVVEIRKDMEAYLKTDKKMKRWYVAEAVRKFVENGGLEDVGMKGVQNEEAKK